MRGDIRRKAPIRSGEGPYERPRAGQGEGLRKHLTGALYVRKIGKLGAELPILGGI